MEVKIFILFFQFSLICLSIPWFFEPKMDYEDNTKLISAHANLLDSILNVPQTSFSVKNLNENFEQERGGKASIENDHLDILPFNENPKIGRVETEREKSSNRKIDDYLDPRRLSRQSFNLRPFENLGRNFGFQIPSSTFSKTNYKTSTYIHYILFNVYFSSGPKRQQPAVPGRSLQVLRG